MSKAMDRAIRCDPTMVSARTLARTALSLDRQRGLALLRDVAKLPEPPRAKFRLSLAATVAAYDRHLRDQELAKDVACLKRLLASKEQWGVEEESRLVRKALSGGPNALIEARIAEVTAEKNRRRSSSELELEMYECLLDSRADSPQREHRIRAICQRAAKLDDDPLEQEYAYDLEFYAKLAFLDPDLLMRCWSATQDSEKFLSFCVAQASPSLGRFEINPFAERLLRYAFEHGIPDPNAIRWYAWIDPEKAVRCAQKMKPQDWRNSNTGHPARALVLSLEQLARKDLDGAWKIARSESDEYVRRDLTAAVAFAWAQEKPESVDRILDSVENDYTRSRLQLAAAIERYRRTGLFPDEPPSIPFYVVLEECRYQPRGKQLELFQRCLSREITPSDQVEVIRAIYRVDRAKALEELRGIRVNYQPHELGGISATARIVAAMGSEAVAIVHKGNPDAGLTAYSSFLVELAATSPDTALGVARAFPADRQENALADVAIGCARRDRRYAEAILEELPRDRREKVLKSDAFWESSLRGQPGRAKEINLQRSNVVRDTAVRAARRDGNSDLLEAMLRSLKEEWQKDNLREDVGKQLDEDPDLAVAVIANIRDCQKFAQATCDLAQAIVSRAFSEDRWRFH